MKSKLLIVTIISLLSFPEFTFSHNTGFLNFGLKLGYVLGQKGGFNIGFEASYTNSSFDGEVKIENFRYMSGILLQINFFNDLTLLHIAYETLSSGTKIGFSAGPSFLVYKEQDRKKTHFGLTAQIFPQLVAIIPYYSFSIFKNYGIINEFGSYLKVPIPLSVPSVYTSNTQK